MPRYYFDYLDGPKSLQDDEGTELPDLEAARSEGLETLGLVAKDEFRTAITATSAFPFAKRMARR